MGIQAKFNWNGDEIASKIKGTMLDRLDFAGITLMNEARDLISRSQPRSGKGARKVGLDPSRPGTPPKRVTGTLHRSVFWALDRQRGKGRVGTPLKYGLFLELGTSKMAARPWMITALRNKREAIKRILSKEIKS
jgi:hypothetical protein